MKKILFFLLVTFQVLFSQTENELTLFIPSDNGFERVEYTGITSFNKIVEYFGYHPDQAYSYWNSDANSKILEVGFEIFSENMIFVLVKGDWHELSTKDVRDYLGDFEWKDKFYASAIEYTLEDGIQNRSISVDFIARIFNIKEYDNNSLLEINKLGYKLQFKDGILVSFLSDDGLNKWAKDWKENFYSRYLSYWYEAQKYWGSDKEAIINEINIQADAFASTQYGFRNKYLKYYTSPEGNVNFKMLILAHENEVITKEEFFIVNHGRYEVVKEDKEADGSITTTYKVNNTLFKFAEDGTFISADLKVR